MKFKFECWEIDFPNDPDGEPTRGTSQELAEEMVARGYLIVQSEGIVTNAYNERVYSHTYTPVNGHEGRVWEIMASEDIDAEPPSDVTIERDPRDTSRYIVRTDGEEA